MKKSMVFIVLFVLLVFLWAVWITVAIKNHEPTAHSYSGGKRGVLFDIEKDPSNFDVEGFVFMEKIPFKGKGYVKNLKTEKIWFLGGEKKGLITLTGLQGRRRKLKDVVLVVKYHVFWEGSAYLAAVGTDTHVHEQVTETLPQGGESYCTRHVFLGPVNQVQLEAETKEKKSFVIIDEMKVSVGTTVFDNVEDVVCL